MSTTTMILGTNEIVDREPAIVVEREEVFRLQDRPPDGTLVVEGDLRRWPADREDRRQPGDLSGD